MRRSGVRSPSAPSSFVTEYHEQNRDERQSKDPRQRRKQYSLSAPSLLLGRSRGHCSSEADGALGSSGSSVLVVARSSSHRERHGTCFSPSRLSVDARPVPGSVP